MNRDDARGKGQDLRRARLSASLRENLKRRKTQERARAAEPQPSVEPQAPPSRDPRS